MLAGRSSWTTSANHYSSPDDGYAQVIDGKAGHRQGYPQSVGGDLGYVVRWITARRMCDEFRNQICNGVQSRRQRVGV